MPETASVPSRLTIVREWTRIGVTGFGGPPAHIELLRRLTVGNGWLEAAEFEDAVAATNMLPGPASTQLAILCAGRLGGPAGAVLGGLGFVAPAVIAMLSLSALFLAHSPPAWVRGAGAGAGAAVAAVAVRAATGLVGPSRRRAAAAGQRSAWGLDGLLRGVGAPGSGAHGGVVPAGHGPRERAPRRPPPAAR